MDDYVFQMKKREPEWLRTTDSISIFIGFAGFLSAAAGAVMAVQGHSLHGILFSCVGILFVFVSFMVGFIVRDFRKAGEEARRTESYNKVNENIDRVEKELGHTVYDNYERSNRKTDELKESVERRIGGIYESLDEIRNRDIPDLRKEFDRRRGEDDGEIWSAIRRIEDGLDLVKSMLGKK